MYLKRLYYSIVHLGLDKLQSYPDYLLRKAKLCNIIAIMCVLVGLSFDLFFQGINLIGPRFVLGVNLVVLLLNWRGYHLQTRWIACLLMPLVALYITLLFTPANVNIPPGRFMGFALIVLPFLLFDAREPAKLTIAALFAVFCFYIYEWPELKDYFRVGKGVDMATFPPPRVFVSFMGLLLLVTGFLYLHYFNVQAENRVAELLVETQEAYEELRVQTELIEEQHEELRSSFALIDRQNQGITDSIHYAKRIQQAILPSAAILAPLPIETFIFYRPRDIVSGDFYWFGQVEDRLILAACDCTGHGVPGAFMSVLGSSLLNQLAGEYHLKHPAALLDRLNEGVVNYLNQHQTNSETLDGIDLALVSIDFQAKTVDFAGAGRPAWLFQGGECRELKGARRSVGGRQTKNEPFENVQASFQSGDTLYLFSDGITDQTGGENGRKLTPKKLREFLTEIQPISLAEQQTRLDQFLTQWQGGLKQLDDMLMIGVRFA